eukprot:184020_1
MATEFEKPFETIVDSSFIERDFDKNGNLFVSKLFNKPWENNFIKRNYECRVYTKCQHLTIQQPLSISYFQSLISTNSNGNFTISIKIPFIGKTSTVSLIDFLFGKFIFATIIGVDVHVDKINHKPCAICNDMLQYKSKYLNQNTINKSLLNHATQKQTELNKSLHEISVKSHSNVLHEKEFVLRFSDCDENNHINQAVYIQLFSDTLFEYNDNYYNGNIGIKAVTVLYIKEMVLDRYKISKCIVKIYFDETKNDIQEIIGTIQQNDEICCKIRMILGLGTNDLAKL